MKGFGAGGMGQLKDGFDRCLRTNITANVGLSCDFALKSSPAKHSAD